MKWKVQNITLEKLNSTVKNTLAESMGIEYVGFGDTYLLAKMPVDNRTFQPAGLLHGGASVALAETIGSLGGYLMLPEGEYDVVGLDINANHMRGVKTGFVLAKTWPLHVGRATQVWHCEIKDESEKLVCVARLTVMNLKKEAF